MSSDSNGIQQSPFGEPVCPTPSESDGFGGANFDQGSGENGIQQSPNQKNAFPAPSGSASGGFQSQPAMMSVKDAPGPGAHVPGDITKTRNTIDER